MTILFANNASSTLAAGINNVVTSLTVATGEGAKFPSPTGGDYFPITLTQGTGIETSWEIVKCTARSGDVLTIVRAQESTTAAAWSSGDKVSLRLTKATMQPAMPDASQAEMEAGTEAALRSMSPLRVKQAIAALASGGISTAASITTSTTLTNASAGYQRIAMTTMGQSVTLPDATTLSIGAPKFYLDNSAGGYPVGVRDSTGVLLMAIAAGGTAYANCEDISTAAGVWAVTGTNIEPGLITIDNTFSSTYASTVLQPFVALDDNKSIHFVSLAAGGFAAVTVDNTTGAVGTPVTVSATASYVPKTCFKITSTTAIVLYGTASASKAVVLSLSGATTLAVGTEAGVGVDGEQFGAEDFSGAPKIAQLSSTLYLTSYTTGTSTKVAAISVSGTTVTHGTPASIITANSVANSTTTYALTATTGLVIYAEAAGAPYTINAVVVSVSGTTCTVSTPASGGTTFSANPGFSCLLSSTKALVGADTNNTEMAVYACTITGTSVAFGSKLVAESGALGSSFLYTGSSATRYNPHLFPLSASTALLWYLDSSGVSRAVVLSESGGTVTKGTILYRSIGNAGASANGGGVILPQGSSEFASIRQFGVANNFQRVLVPQAVTGTSIIDGAGIDLPGIALGGNADRISAVRLSSGNYVIYGNGNGSDFQCPSLLPVFRSNGVSTAFMGSVKVPRISIDSGNGMAPLGVVSSNRLVLIGAAAAGTPGASTYQLRLLNVEIAK